MLKLHVVELYVIRHSELLQQNIEYEPLFHGGMIRSLCLCPGSRIVHDHFIIVIEVDVNDDAPDYDNKVVKEFEDHLDFLVELMAIKDFSSDKRYKPHSYEALDMLHKEVTLGCPPHRVPIISENECAEIQEYIEQEKQAQAQTAKYFDAVEVSDVPRMLKLLDRLVK